MFPTANTLKIGDVALSFLSTYPIPAPAKNKLVYPYNNFHVGKRIITHNKHPLKSLFIIIDIKPNH